MFRGGYEHNIDAKGRLSIPAKFREILIEKYSGTLVLTKFDLCLVAYPLEEWVILEEKMKSLPTTQKDVRSFLRFIYFGANECKVDKQGRILIPPILREYAKLDKEAIVVGVINRIEIWSKEKWEESNTETQFENFTERMGEMGI